MTNKTSINLLQNEFFPEKKTINAAKNDWSLVGTVFIVMTAWAVFNDYQYQKIAKQHQLLKNEKSTVSRL